MDQARSDDPTIAHLRRIISSRRRHFRHVAGYNSSLAMDRNLLGLDCDEVYPNIFVADRRTARDRNYLHHLGITHILNVAEQEVEDAMWYHGSSISYMGIAMADNVAFQISSYFEITANYIDNSLKSGGKVLVNCLRGVSRSGAIVLSYLMIKCGLGAPLALRIVLQNRNICPNDGFLFQLNILDQTLQPNST